jgi:CPA2 family monovalent cation:H+ antiporter-2
VIHSDLILTLVSAFVAAFVAGFIAGRLGLPPIVGYLLAGVAIGPHTPGGSADTTIASDLAEVGVVLLMFGVGLHFSLKELLSVGRIAIPGAIGQSMVATLLGIGASQLWGWSITDGLIFGLCLSVASTVVLLRALEDRNLIETHAGRVAVGWLIVEDIFTVLILILLPAFADSEESAGGIVADVANLSPSLEVIAALAQAAVFVFLMLFLGARLIPRLLSEVVRAGSRELFTLCILALALGVSFGSAELFGTSLALGAFLAGIVLNESELSHRAGLEALPLRDAFAVLFFVSVGMLFEPDILVDEPMKVALVVAIIVAGKALAAWFIVAGLGYGIRTGITVAAALAQIGEFSFILAALGNQLDLLPEEATSLILAGAIISITLNPFLFARVDGVAEWLSGLAGLRRLAERRAPEEEQEEVALRRHVVICGFGRAGALLARILSGRGLPFVIVENDPFVYERARDAGYTCVFGDATQLTVLEQAGVDEARALAVTFSAQPSGPIAVHNALSLNEHLNVVARGSGPETHQLLIRAGASEVVDPYLETGLEFVRHVLHRFGIDSRQIAALQAQWRAETLRG